MAKSKSKSKSGGQGRVAKYKYIFPHDHNPVFVTGAYGGVIPTGEIAVNFYLERHGLPYSQTYQISPDNTLGAIAETDPPDHAAALVR